MNYDSKKFEDSNPEHYASLKGLTNRLNTGVEYVKNSIVGKTFGNIKDEIALSAYQTKEALRKPETRKLWLINHVVKNIPEIITAGYLIAFGIADYRYYQDSKLAKLASSGLTTEGVHNGASLNVVKPWIAPPEKNIPTDYEGFIPLNYVRRLTIWEDDKVGAPLGLIPAAAKYVWKGVKHFRKKKD